MQLPAHHEPDRRILARLEKIEKVALSVVAVVAGCTFLLWNVPELAALMPSGWQGMREVTAGGLVIAAVSLALASPRRSGLPVLLATAGAAFLVIVPLIVLATYAGFQPKHPEWWPTRPPVETAAALAISNLGLVLVRRTAGILSRLADLCACFLSAFALFLFGALAIHGKGFLGADESTLTAPHTVLCLLLLAFVVVSRRAAAGGWLRMLVGSGIGSDITRRMLPAAIATPFLVVSVVGWLDRVGLVPLAYGRSAMGPVIVLGIVGVTMWMGRHANILEWQLRQQSLTDELTGVLNRRGFDTVADYVIRNAERSGSSLIAFFFDLDGLKRANDLHGHEAGSLIIQRFADLLVVTFRKSDVVARVGGDEFVILAPALSETADDILARLKRVVDSINSSGLVASPISYSVGYAELPRKGGKLDDLVAEADARMYAQKSRKRKRAA